MPFRRKLEKGRSWPFRDNVSCASWLRSGSAGAVEDMFATLNQTQSKATGFQKAQVSFIKAISSSINQ